MPVIELRRYTLLPGRRDELINLFEAELMEPQEDCGIRVIGTFKDLEDPQKFVWIRAFPDMPRRAESLRDFYYGPVWRRHREAANATMIDSDDVLLLKPGWDESDFALARDRVPPDTEPGLVQVGIVSLPAPPGEGDLTYFRDEVAPRIEASGATVLACLVTEDAANTFPALPVREDGHVLAWFAGIPDGVTDTAVHELRRDLNRAVQEWAATPAAVEVRALIPTRRSPLTGNSRTHHVASQSA